MDRTPESTDIVLIGLMGAGKTTIGFVLAERLHRPFVDSDTLLFLHEQRTAREIADEEGLDALHRAEHDMARIAMSASSTVVFAAAASLMDLDTVAANDILDGAWVVWLHASADTLEQRVTATRLTGDTHRPEFDDEMRAERCRLGERRRANAQRLADLRVDVTTATPHQAVDEIIAAWEAHRWSAA